MDNLRIQIIAQKIFELLEFTGMTEEEFFDKCLSEPTDIAAGILHPETEEILFGFCNHKTNGLLFYLPEDLDFNVEKSTQNRLPLSKSEAKRQILFRQSPSENDHDSP